MKKWICSLLTVVMTLSLLSYTTFAEENDNTLPMNYVDTSNELMYKALSSETNNVALFSEGEHAGKKVEIAFVIDTTSSMNNAISNVKSSITEFANYLEEQGVNLRMSVVEFKDIVEDGENTTIVHTINHSPWHTSTEQLIETLSNISVSGGGDGPETVIDGLGCLLNNSGSEETIMRWSSDAYKFAFVLTDASYKTDNKWGYSDMTQMISALNAKAISTSVITSTSNYSVYNDLTEKTDGALADIYSSDFVSSLKSLADNALANTVRPESIDVTVNAISKDTNEEVPVEGATVSVFIDDEVRYYNTDSDGIATIPLTGLSDEQIARATVSAYKAWSFGVVDPLTNNRYYLQSMITNDEGVPERYIYELHSENIDDDGNWYGESLSNVVNGDNVEFIIDEPRLLVNMSVCYFEGEEAASLSGYEEIYKEAVIDSMNKISKNLAQATDGHLMINKLLIGKVDNLYDFYITDNGNDTLGSLADVRIVGDTIGVIHQDGAKFYYEPINITQNANVGGFYSDKPCSAYTKLFKNLSKAQLNTISKRKEYQRVQLSSYVNYGSTETTYNISSDKWARTATHELGHYVLGIFDDYLSAIKNYADNENYVMWGDPYTDAEGNQKKVRDNDYNYGLIDNKLLMTSADIEISSTRDYSSDYNNRETNTAQSFRYKASAENVFADFLQTGMIIDPDSEETTETNILKKKALNVPYKVNYTLSDNDRLSEYSYAELDDEDYMWYNGNDAASTDASLISWDNSAASFALNAAMNKNIQSITIGKNGYIYNSPDNKLYAYFIPEEDVTFTFEQTDELLNNDDYISVNSSTKILTDKDISCIGELYSVASIYSDIDYTTVSWFKYDGSTWTKLDTDLTSEENMNIGARCDYAGEGTYVLMAKPASDEQLAPVTDIEYTNPTDRDGIVKFTFNDSNAETAYYNIYYSANEFASKDDENVMMDKAYAGNDSYSIDLEERNKDGYVAIEAVAENGAKSPLSEVVKVNTGEADRDGDGIPDWYCDKYLLWPPSGEEKDIAGSDDDNDGLTNLEEYKGGSDPTDPDDPVKTSNVAVDSIELNKETIRVNIGRTATVTAEITPADASNKKVQWYTDDESIAAVSGDGLTCTIEGVAEGTTQITAVTEDGGFTASADVTVSRSSGGSGGGGMTALSDVEADIKEGTVTKGTQVTLSHPTNNVTIYYTTDGTTPTTGSIKYTAPITVNEDTTIKAIAVKSGYRNSSVVTFEYVVDKKPTFKLKENAAEIKYMAAYDDGSFKPDQAATRYEILEALNKLFDFENITDSASFPDVSEQYKELVNKFTCTGVIIGYEDGTFRGNNGITRAELVKILSIMFDNKDNGYGNESYSDISGHWARSYINAYAKSGYVHGYPDGTFRPDNQITRAEFVTIINNILGIDERSDTAYTGDVSSHWAHNDIAHAMK